MITPAGGRSLEENHRLNTIASKGKYDLQLLYGIRWDEAMITFFGSMNNLLSLLYMLKQMQAFPNRGPPCWRPLSFWFHVKCVTRNL